MTGQGVLTCGYYCPSCGDSVTRTAAGRFLTLAEWEERNAGRVCRRCGSEIMPQEFPASDAAGVWAMIHNHG